MSKSSGPLFMLLFFVGGIPFGIIARRIWMQHMSESRERDGWPRDEDARDLQMTGLVLTMSVLGCLGIYVLGALCAWTLWR